MKIREIQTSPEINGKRPNYPLRRFGAATLLALTLLGAVKGAELVKKVVNHIANPVDFSDEIKDVYAHEGDTVWGMAKGVKGAENVDLRIVVDKIEDLNKDVLADGLQAGEVVAVPEEVIPK